MSKVKSSPLRARVIVAARVVGVVLFLLQIVYSKRARAHVQEARRSVEGALLDCATGHDGSST